MRPKFDYGDAVRVTRNVRNDGTFPGQEIGTLLVRRGSVGHVQNVGTFLQDQIIYSVHFLDADKIVGCRQEELLDADESWTPSRFEFRDKVTARIALSVKREVVVASGDIGEIIKVIRDAPTQVAYHVRFPGRTLQVPESVLDEVKQDAGAKGIPAQGGVEA